MAFMDDIKAKASDLLKDPKGAFEKAQDKLGDVVDKVQDNMGDWAEKAQDVAGDLVEKAKDATGDLVEKAKDMVDGDNDKPPTP